MGTWEQSGKNNPRSHGDARAAGRGARGAPGREGARGRSAEAAGRAPGLARRPSVSVLSSGRAPALEPAGLTEERPFLPLGFCSQASPAGRKGSRHESPPTPTPGGAPGKSAVTTRARPPPTRPGTERPGRSLGATKKRPAAAKLGLPGRSPPGTLPSRGQGGEVLQVPLQGLCENPARSPAASPVHHRRTPGPRGRDRSLFRRGKEEEKGDGAVAPQCACARFQFFFF